MEYFFRNYAVFTSHVPTDIYPVQYGEQQCRANYEFGPCVRNNYILHYVYSGKGVLKIGEQEFEIHPGQLFLIKPNQLAGYRADSNDPWLYRWIEFNGSMSQKILSVFNNSPIPVIDDCDENPIGKKIAEFVKDGSMEFELAMEKLWSFIYTLTQSYADNQQVQSQDYVKIAEAYIKNNMHQKVTVNDIAEHIGINRSYLSRLFKEHKKISLQQYIIYTKMNTAAQYLKNTDISVIEAAQSVGYDDYHVFNKAFHKQFNLSPSVWRKKHFWEQSIRSESD